MTAVFACEVMLVKWMEVALYTGHLMQRQWCSLSSHCVWWFQAFPGQYLPTSGSVSSSAGALEGVVQGLAIIHFKPSHPTRWSSHIQPQNNELKICCIFIFNSTSIKYSHVKLVSCAHTELTLVELYGIHAVVHSFHLTLMSKHDNKFPNSILWTDFAACLHVILSNKYIMIFLWSYVTLWSYGHSVRCHQQYQAT